MREFQISGKMVAFFKALIKVSSVFIWFSSNCLLLDIKLNSFPKGLSFHAWCGQSSHNQPQIFCVFKSLLRWFFLHLHIPIVHLFCVVICILFPDF